MSDISEPKVTIILVNNSNQGVVTTGRSSTILPTESHGSPWVDSDPWIDSEPWKD